ncbi:MAG: hypothetical protein AAGA65_24260 [Actinomycetota bacterium]
MTGRSKAVMAIAFVILGAAVYWWTPLGRGGPGVDGPVIHSGFSFGGDGEDALIEGTVVLDGDCLYIKAPDAGVRYPVVWPHGSRWQDEPAGVILPGGAVALLGTPVSGGGGYHSDRSRIESVTGDAGTQLALRCAEDPYREVAIFNPGSSVEAID